MEKTNIFEEMRDAREKELDEHFAEIISKLEVRTKENPFKFFHLFKRSIPTHFKTIRFYDNEIKLEDARQIFGAAYKAIVEGTYYDASVPVFDGLTDEYFFREGVHLARNIEKQAKRETQ
jgi:hypothetical protein